jgi:hypothetical protein
MKANGTPRIANPSPNQIKNQKSWRFLAEAASKSFCHEKNKVNIMMAWRISMTMDKYNQT